MQQKRNNSDDLKVLAILSHLKILPKTYYLHHFKIKLQKHGGIAVEVAILNTSILTKNGEQQKIQMFTRLGNKHFVRTRH